LWINIIRFHVTCSYSQYLTICHVINMITYRSPTLNMFDMIKHGPHILKVSSSLHAYYNINTTYRPMCRHFEKVNLGNTLIRENIILDVIIT
jgi:hypothetical protein